MSLDSFICSFYILHLFLLLLKVHVPHHSNIVPSRVSPKGDFFMQTQTQKLNDWDKAFKLDFLLIGNIAHLV